MNFLRRDFYTRQQIKEKFWWLKPILDHDGLWTLNARSAAFGVFAGVFAAFIPIPMHTVIAILLAWGLRGYMPFAIGLVWINNPFTLLPIIYADYRMGCFLLNQVPLKNISWNEHQIVHDISQLWLPLLSGSVVMGFICAAFGLFISFLVSKIKKANIT